MAVTKIIKLKDIFAVLLGTEVTIMLAISPDTFQLKFLLLYLLPLGISSIVWNKRLYISLMDNENALYAKSKMSFKTFIIIGLFLSMITVVAFATSIYRWW